MFTALETLDNKERFNQYQTNLIWYTYLKEDETVSFVDCQSSILNQMKELDAIDFDIVGIENLSSILKRLLAGIFNTFFHVLNTAKTNIFRSYKNLKRTELVYYKESNLVSYGRIFNREMSLLTSLDTPIPYKMGVTYFHAISKTIAFLDVMGLANRVKSFLQYSEELRNEVLSSAMTSNKLPTLSVIAGDLERLSKEFKALDNCFKDKPVRFKKFIEVFPTKDEFVQCEKILYDATKYQYEVASIHSTMESIGENFTKIISFLDKSTLNLTKEELMSLSKVTLFFAKIFDMYGVAIRDLTRLEHNYVEVLKMIRKEYNL